LDSKTVPAAQPRDPSTITGAAGQKPVSQQIVEDDDDGQPTESGNMPTKSGLGGIHRKLFMLAGALVLVLGLIVYGLFSRNDGKDAASAKSAAPTGTGADLAPTPVKRAATPETTNTEVAEKAAPNEVERQPPRIEGMPSNGHKIVVPAPIGFDASKCAGSIRMIGDQMVIENCGEHVMKDGSRLPITDKVEVTAATGQTFVVPFPNGINAAACASHMKVVGGSLVIQDCGEYVFQQNGETTR
jgi:hypothetical protein